MMRLEAANCFGGGISCAATPHRAAVTGEYVCRKNTSDLVLGRSVQIKQ